MNLIDRIAATISPAWAVSRHVARYRLERLYEAAKSSPRHTARTGGQSGDGVMDHARNKLTYNARYLDENHDLVTGMLSDLAQQATTARIEPMVRRRDGTLNEEVNNVLSTRFATWADHAESTGALGWSDMCFLSGLSWLRDGEVFGHRLLGADFDYRTDIPLALELLESDFLPFDKYGRDPAIIHGVEKDSAGRAVAFHFAESHPGDSTVPGSVRGISPSPVRVAADRISHLKIVRRIGQTRGVSLLHPLLRRLEDIKDYEESERIAARVAADLCAVIIRGAEFGAQTVGTQTNERPMNFQAGMIFDGVPGDDVRMLGSQRPNPALEDYRKGQLRAAVAGAGASYSTTARDYDGSYSSQRQELVENNFRYRRLRQSFAAQFLRPLWRDFVRATVLAGFLPARGLDPSTLFKAEISSGQIPWIDKQKEVKADREAVEAGFTSRWQVIRERGGDPRKVDAERETDTQPGAPAAPATSSPDDDAGDDQKRTLRAV